MLTEKINVFWFRRDLRLHDNVGLWHALSGHRPVLCVYHFDNQIMSFVKRPQDARVSFIHERLQMIHEGLQNHGSGLLVDDAEFLAFWDTLLTQYDIDTIFSNRDYEPIGRKREEELAVLSSSKGCKLMTFHDHVLLPPEEVRKDDGQPYQVFTPYYKRYVTLLEGQQRLQPFQSESKLGAVLKMSFAPLPTLKDWGFEPTSLRVMPYNLSEGQCEQYESLKDYPSISGTTQLGPHLRYGSISVREVARVTYQGAEPLFRQLVWREFFMQILWKYPEVVNHNFKRKYDAVQWRNDEREFALWCEGRTGIPLVDAGIRELLSTGYMHNRVRMVVGSFLCKNLLIDWRWGEAFFARHLLDYEMAANNGNWQWVAGTGCDAAPYFRVFNPLSQQKKFDQKGEYLAKFLPNYAEENLQPMVDLKTSRERAIATYRSNLSEKQI